MEVLKQLLLFWIRAKNKYDRIKDNGDEEGASLAITSIVNSILFVVITIFSLWGIKELSQISGGTEALGALLGIFLLIIVIISTFFHGLLYSFICWVFQLILNRRIIGFVAMFIWFAACAAGFYVGWYCINNGI